MTLAAVLVQVLEENGLQREEVLSECNLSEDLFLDPDEHLTAVQFGHLMDQCGRINPTVPLGLQFGEKATLACLGPLGMAIMHGKTLGEALEFYLRCYPIVDQFAKISVHDLDHGRSLYQIEIPEYWPGTYRKFSIEAFFSCLIANAKILSGKELKPFYINFDYERGEKAKTAYENFFDCSINFNNAHNGVVFDRSHLDLPIISSNAALYNIYRSQCEQMLLEVDHAPTLSSKIEKYVLSHMEASVQVSDVADHLGMSKKTLANRLKKEGTNFQEVVNTTRAKQAKKLLQSSSLSVEEIAAVIGFSDASNFRKAFKKWTGSPPSEFRGRANVDTLEAMKQHANKSASQSIQPIS